MRYRLALTLTAGSLSSAAALAQSFNIDLNTTSGAGAGAPAASFAGAAQQPGTWNAVPMTGAQTVALVGLDGLPTPVTLMKPTVGAAANNFSNATGEFARLMDDGLMLTSAQGQSMTLAINNLSAGKYIVYTYGFDVGSGPATNVTNHASHGIDAQQVDGKVLANDMMPGTAFTVHGTDIIPGTSIVLVISRNDPGDPSTKAAISGIQIRKISGPERIRLHANKTPSAPQDGASWASGYVELQPALSIAQRAGGSSFEIWAKQGFYRPTTGTDRNASFVIPSNLRLFGGFAGTETAIEQRTAFALFITAMAGSIGSGTATDNSYTVVDASNTSANTLIDGFSISNGYNNNSGNGGGVRIFNGQPTFRNCKFLSNVAFNSGGAVWMSAAQPKFVNCLFYNNDCNNGSGGAIGANSGGKLGLYNVQIIGNYAGGEGGGVYLNNTPADIHSVLFSGNTATVNSGALHCSSEAADADIRFSTFSANACANGAGGIALSSGADVTIRSSILWGNIGQVGNTIEHQQLSLSIGGASTYDMTHTTVEGLSSYNGFKCNGINPGYIDPNGPDNVFGTTDDNCRLQAGSPCIDAGAISELPADLGDIDEDNNTIEPLPIDLDKKLRRVESAVYHNNNGSGSVPFVDRGPYEFVPLCPGDTNGDAMVNFTDLNAVLSNFGQSGFGLLGDLNGDNVVNFLDLNLVLSNFGMNC